MTIHNIPPIAGIIAVGLYAVSMYFVYDYIQTTFKRWVIFPKNFDRNYSIAQYRDVISCMVLVWPFTIVLCVIVNCIITYKLSKLKKESMDNYVTHKESSSAPPRGLLDVHEIETDAELKTLDPKFRSGMVLVKQTRSIYSWDKDTNSWYISSSGDGMSY